VLESGGTWLGEVVPIVQYLELSQYQVSDFIHNGGAALADTTVSPSGGMGHYLRQLGPNGAESLAIHRERLSSNRGNTYFMPGQLNPTPKQAEYQMFGNWDCKPSGGEVKGSDEENRLGCWVPPNIEFQGRIQGRFPHVEKADYSK
jgi:phospholipid/cholesterol/gamma-HCH transport system substrate-binding protein